MKLLNFLKKEKEKEEATQNSVEDLKVYFELKDHPQDLVYIPEISAITWTRDLVSNITYGEIFLILSDHDVIQSLRHKIQNIVLKYWNDMYGLSTLSFSGVVFVSQSSGSTGDDIVTEIKYEFIAKDCSSWIKSS